MSDHNAPATPAAPGTPLRLLLAEDRLSDAELLLSRLKRLGYRVESRRVWTEERFVEALTALAPELIVSDYSMPAFDGLTALGIARRLVPQVPFVFVSGSIEAAQVAVALEAGAAGYLSKNDLGPLAPLLQRVLGATRAG
jgi:CheY-like chemotaxis protein